MEYNFREIEKKRQKRWVENKTYQVTEDETKKKFYVLNMFPYPSGAGLHVGHPLGYFASDIYARYKRLQGFNVLNPMGYDAYGLPAEQYAIQTGQHPAITTVNNINRYREQLDKIGFSFDWNREIRTCEPEYYHWTQWAFQKMFNSYYFNDEKQARPIQELIEFYFSAFAASNPVLLGFFQGFGPVDGIESVQQALCIGRYTETPLTHLLLNDGEAASFAYAVHHFIVGKYGSQLRAPVYHRLPDRLYGSSSGFPVVPFRSWHSTLRR